MAIASTTVWELNASATAANACGGGFNPGNASPGTDYTLAANNANYPAAKYTFTDLAGTNANTATPTVTSLSHSFVAADNGNIIHITAGTSWTQGWYEIVSTSGGAATLDRACASIASPTAGTYQVGGAISLGSSTTNQTDSSFFASTVVAGNTIWMKAGSYTAGVTFTTAAGSRTAPVMWHGYNSTRGDAPTGSSRPTMAMGALAPIISSWWMVDNIIFMGSAASVLNLGANLTLINLKVTNTSTTASQSAIIGGATCMIRNCELISYRGNAYNAGSNTTYLYGNYIHDSDIGTTMSTGALYAFDNIYADNVTAAVQTSGSGTVAFLADNTFYGAENKLGTALNNFNTTNFFTSLNNIIYGFVTGTNMTGVYGVFEDYNDYFNNSTDVVNITKGAHDQAVDPQFVNVAQLTGTSGVVSSSTLTVSSATGVVANQDFVYIVSGTGATAGKYLITNVAGTTLTLSSAPGGSGTNIVYQITTGHNFQIGNNLRNKGFPGTFPASLTISQQNIGAVQTIPTLAATWCE